ncbi:MAG: NAD(P)/FAD-dependent oxidoreductase [Rubrobacter sp.]|nr:FAD-dependent oxidoreductase [Rubrobacteraceae bacterium]MDQ3437377.1 FAD-dependent oxidoreductase [Actinomycetota bacterium]
MSDDPNRKTCIIVGAGISGLLAASTLQREGWNATVLDESSGVGGRMATRRVGGGNFDHGAQFFTVRSERFAGLVEGWLGAGVAAEWTRGFADAEGRPDEDGHPRYRGAEGMISIPNYIARGLDVRTGERIVKVDDGDTGWVVVCESGLRVAGNALVLTAPVPQALDLISSGSYRLPDGAMRQLEAVTYDPCLALMLLLDGPTGVPEPGGMQIKSEPLDWIGDNWRKGISEAAAVTVHAGPEWSRSHFEDDETEVIDSMISLAGDRLGIDLASAVIETSLVRWRYSWVTDPHPEPCFVASDDPPLLFCGDAFGQPKVEGASLSGLAAADRLLGRDPR